MTGGLHALGAGGLPCTKEGQSPSALTAILVKQQWVAWEDSKTDLLSPLTPPQYPAGALSFSFIQNVACVSFVLICLGSGFYLSPPALTTLWP